MPTTFTHYEPGPEDPIFSTAFTVISPVRGRATTKRITQGDTMNNPFNPRTVYNVNVNRRTGRVHLVGCWQGDLHRSKAPSRYEQIPGGKILPDKEPCRFCLG